MAVSLSCPSCRAPLRLKAAPPPGAIGRCPRCRGVVPLTPAAEPTPPGGVPTEAYQPAAETACAPTRVGPVVVPPARVPEFLAPPERPDELGRLGHYRVLERLGAGGMGMVFRAEDTQLRRQVALKVMLPEFAADPPAKARFVREAQAQAAVDHDHVVTVYEAREFAGVAYLTMPLLTGQTLGAALRANPRPPLAEVLRVGREVAAGLAAAHAVGLIHRDIKPSNIWLDVRHRRVKILDFGLARAADTADDAGADAPAPADPADGPLTVQGTVLGTPMYMSPEQARGGKVDHRTDLFSLGVVLYQMATGELPFTGASTTEVLAAVGDVRPAVPAVVDPAVPGPVSDLVMRLLAKAPADRPPTAAGVAEELQWLGASAGLSARPVVLPVPPADDPWQDIDAGDPAPTVDTAEGERPRRRGPMLVAAGVLAAGAVVAVVLAAWPKRSDPHADTGPPAAAGAPSPQPAVPQPPAKGKDKPPTPTPPDPVKPPTPDPVPPNPPDPKPVDPPKAAPPDPPKVTPEPPKPAPPDPLVPRDDEFKPYTSAAGRYTAHFPGEVMSRTSTVPQGKDVLRLTLDTVAYKTVTTYMVSFVDYPDAAAKRPPGPRLDGFRDVARGATGRVLEERDVAVGPAKYPGRDLLIELPAGYLRNRLVIAGRRLYQVSMLGPKEYVTSPAADRFFASFAVTE